MLTYFTTFSSVSIVDFEQASFTNYVLCFIKNDQQKQSSVLILVYLSAKLKNLFLWFVAWINGVYWSVFPRVVFHKSFTRKFTLEFPSSYRKNVLSVQRR